MRRRRTPSPRTVQIDGQDDPDQNMTYIFDKGHWAWQQAPRKAVSRRSAQAIPTRVLSACPGTRERPGGSGCRTKKKGPERGPELIRRRPTLPGGCPPSTIGASGLNFSVRNGKRCTPAAITAETVKGAPGAHPQNSIAATS